MKTTEAEIAAIKEWATHCHKIVAIQPAPESFEVAALERVDTLLTALEESQRDNEGLIETLRDQVERLEDGETDLIVRQTEAIADLRSQLTEARATIAHCKRILEKPDRSQLSVRNAIKYCNRWLKGCK